MKENQEYHNHRDYKGKKNISIQEKNKNKNLKTYRVASVKNLHVDSKLILRKGATLDPIPIREKGL